MSEKSDLRQPQMGEYDGNRQWNCQWPGCEFDTLEEAQWREHIDPVTGAHREPTGLPGVGERRLLPDERAELEELRAFKAKADAAAAKEAALADAGKTKGE